MITNHHDYLAAVNETWQGEDHIDAQFTHALLGLIGEVGEVTDLLKKMTYYKGRDQHRDLHELFLELGDVEYYLAKLEDIAGMPKEDIWTGNIDKLRKRYPERYTNNDHEQDGA